MTKTDVYPLSVQTKNKSIEMRMMGFKKASLNSGNLVSKRKREKLPEGKDRSSTVDKKVLFAQIHQF